MSRRNSQATSQASALMDVITALSQLNEGELKALKTVIERQTSTHATAQPTAPAKQSTKKSASKPATPKYATREEALTAKYGDKDARIAYLKSVGKYTDPSKNDEFNKAWATYVEYCKKHNIDRNSPMNKRVAAEIRANGYKFKASMANA